MGSTWAADNAEANLVVCSAMSVTDATASVSVREGLESSESLVILSWAPIREVPDVVCGEPRPL